MTAGILRSMLGLYCNETYGAMKKCDNGDGGGDNDDNAAAGSVSDIWSLIQSKHLGLEEEYWATVATALRPRHTMYLRVGLYIYPINTIVKMYHKLLYAEIGVLYLCCWNMKKITSWIIPYPFHIKYNTTPSLQTFAKSYCGCLYCIIRRIK